MQLKSNTIIRRAFDRGQVPTIACFNKATDALGVNLDKLLAALQKFVDRYLVPVWGTPARLVHSTDFIKGAWAMVFLDNADRPGSLARHDLTPEGLPIAKIFVKTIKRYRQQVSVAASHELVEMLVDPALNLYSKGPNPRLVYAYEVADPVEESTFKLDGFHVTDFVYPSYFDVFRKPSSDRFDHLKKVKRPFQILAGGYQIVFKNGKRRHIFGSKAKARRFQNEDRRGRRSTLLGHQHSASCKAAPKWGKILKRY